MSLQLQIISRPSLRGLEDIVGSEDQPELLLSGRIASIEVRVIRLGGPVKCRLDRLFAGTLRHAKSFIRRRGHSTSLASLCLFLPDKRLKRSLAECNRHHWSNGHQFDF